MIRFPFPGRRSRSPPTGATGEGGGSAYAKIGLMRSLPVGLLFLLALLLGPGAAENTGKSALDKPTLEAYVRHLLLWGPQIKVSISDPKPSELKGFYEVRVRGTAGRAYQEDTFYISSDGQKIVRAVVYDVDKNPFFKNIAKLHTESAPSLGTPGAPVKLVLFTDFGCAFCRKESEILRTNLLKTFPDQVRLYFKDLPLESIHPWSKKAAIAGRCVYAQSEDAFWTYHDWMFAHQREITLENLNDKVLEFARGVPGLDTLRLGRCLETRATEKEVDESLAEARALGLNATPTLFINGRRISSQLPWANLKQIIELELDYQKSAMDAGDAGCCAVKLPTPLPDAASQ